MPGLPANAPTPNQVPWLKQLTSVSHEVWPSQDLSPEGRVMYKGIQPSLGVPALSCPHKWKQLVPVMNLQCSSVGFPLAPLGLSKQCESTAEQ